MTIHLRKQFPDRTNLDLAMLNSSAWCWIKGRVFDASLEPEPHPLLVAAAFLYMQHICEKDPKRKAAHLFNAHELLSIFG